MNIIRVAARSMLASYFVFSGIKSVTNPEPLVAEAEPLVNKVVPHIKQVASFVPQDTTLLIRATGAAQIVGGLGLALGIFRRPSALLLAGTMAPHVLAVNPGKGATDEIKSENRSHFIRNLAFMGAALLASQDLQGRPSLGWRADQLKRSTGKQVDGLSRKARKQAKQFEKAAQKQMKQAQKDAKKLGKQVAEVLPA